MMSRVLAIRGHMPCVSHQSIEHASYRGILARITDRSSILGVECAAMGMEKETNYWSVRRQEIDFKDVK